MARPFNFFQYVTGVPMTGFGLLNSGIAIVNPDFEQFLSGFGLYTPPSFLQDSKHLWLLNADFEFLPASLNVVVSGYLNGTNVHLLTNNTVFSGHFFPVNSGEVAFIPIFSGNTRADNIDTFGFYIPFTGVINACPLDLFTSVVVLSGKQFDYLDDTSTFNISVGGAVSGQPVDTVTNSVFFTGNIVKYTRDNAVLSINLETVVWNIGSPVRTERISGQNILDISLDYVYWRID